MGSKTNSIVVLTPNGRRETVQVSLDESVLQILEDICKKYGLDCNNYSLKHYNQILDPTSVLRFSGLTNNAFLEMVPNKFQMPVSKAKVMISLQINGENERLTGEFNANSTLEEVVSALSPKVFENTTQVPVVIYMRREVVGIDALRFITLRALGLTSGRALLRFTFRDSEEHPVLQFTGNSSISSKFSQSKDDSEANNRPGPSSSNSDPSRPPYMSKRKPTFETQSIPAAEILTALEVVKDVINIVSEPFRAQLAEKDKKPTGVDEGEASKTSSVSSDARKSSSITSSGSKSITSETKKSSASSDLKKTSSGGSDAKKSNASIPVDGGSKTSSYSQRTSSVKISHTPMEIDRVVSANETFVDINLDDVKYLSKRKGLVFQLQTSNTSFSQELPESFFDVTVDDVRLLMRDLKRAREGLENAPLETEVLRKVRRDSKAKSYATSIIRIQFPDRLVLQGVFKSDEHVSDVINFVKSYLKNPKEEFYLYTSPPKRVLSANDTLMDADCVPCAKVYFAYSNQDLEASKCLNDEAMSCMTNQDIATFAACSFRGLKYQKDSALVNVEKSDDGSVSKSRESFQVSSRRVSESRKNGSGSSFRKESVTSESRSSGSKAPKWFKPT